MSDEGQAGKAPTEAERRLLEQERAAQEEARISAARKRTRGRRSVLENASRK